MTSRRRHLVLAWAVTAASCRDEVVEPAPRDPVVLVRAGYSVLFDLDAVELTLRRGDEALVSVPRGGFVLGEVDAVDDLASYDPWPLLEDPLVVFAPSGLAWLPAESAALVGATDASFTVELSHASGQKSRLTVDAAADGRFRAAMTPVDATQIAFLEIGLAIGPDEAFYGLGEWFDVVDHRGRRRAMQIEPANLESGYNEAHVPVPLVIGTRGWGLFVESTRPGAFDVAASDPGRLAAVFGTGVASGEGLTFHLLASDHPLDVTKRYYDVAGYPRLPPPWALGPLVWRDENLDQAQVESDLDTMRDLDLATSGIWIDRPYATGVNTFDFEAARFPDPDAMIQKAQGLGFRVALWHTPYLDERDPSTAVLRAEAEAGGFWPLVTGLNLNGWGRPIDFTSPAATAWWQDNLRRYTARGIEGFKLDYGEDVVPGLAGARNIFLFHDGTDERTMHHGYTLAYHRTYGEVVPEGFLLCRAGKWGDQVNGCVIWPGDLDARMWMHGQEVTEGGETFRAVGGLHASIVAGLGLGPSGFPFYGADTGGYRHSPPSPETFRRWFEQTALSSVMQIGTSSNDVAWELGDPELLASYRDYTRLHLRLFPYAWTLAHEVLETGRPIQRPFGLVHPELGLHPSDEYFLGDALFVAPVTEEGADAREIVFPPGRWIGFWDGTVVEGPATVTLPAPLGALPLYLRAGAPLPMLRETIDTIAPTTDPARVDSFATAAGPLFVRVAPGPASTLRVYDGAVLSQASTDADVTITIERGSVFTGPMRVELVGWGGTKPSSVTAGGAPAVEVPSKAGLDGAPGAWFFDAGAAAGTVWIAVPAGAGAVRVVR